jgi:hypothetical protein
MLEMQYGGEGVRIEWGFMLMVDSGQGPLFGMSECLMANRMLFWCLYISSSFSLQRGIILCGTKGIDAGFMPSYHHFELKKKGDCHQHEPVPAAVLAVACILLMRMPSRIIISSIYRNF